MRFMYAKTSSGAVDIRRAHPTDAGIDFFIPTDWNDGKPFTLGFGDSVVIDSGIKVEIDPGMMAMFANKGGVASKKKLIYGAHISDTYYSGNVFIDIHNIGCNPVTIEPGEKIIQMILVPIIPAIPMLTTEDKLYEGMLPDSIRGEGKQGSTGVK